MARFIEARVIQKVDTEQNWNANELILYKGEIALVGDPDRVYNIKVGNGVKKFRDLPYMVNYVNGLYTGVITPQSQVPSGINNVFLITQPGTYTNFGGVVLPKDNLGIIYKNGNNYTIQLIPIVSEEKLQEYIDEKLVNSNLGFGGEITDLNQSPNVQGMYIPKVNGVYPNFGNLEYDSTEGLTLFLYKDNQFSKIVVPLNAVEGDVNFNNNTLGVSGSAVEKYAVKKINTISNLRNTVGEYEGQIITLLGYYESGDKESLNYKWTNTQGVDDGGSVINSGSGSWIAIFSNHIDVKDFGAKGDGLSDDAVFIQKALNCGGRIYLSKGEYYINSNSGLWITRDNTELYGDYGESFLIEGEKTVIDDFYSCTLNILKNDGLNIYNIKINNISFKGGVDSWTNEYDQMHHNINAMGVKGLEIRNCIFNGFLGDAIILSAIKQGNNNYHYVCEDVVIKNNIIDGVNNENRNAISIISGVNVKIHNNKISNCTRFDMPGAIDIEPESGSFHVCKNIKIYNNEFINIGGNIGIISFYFGWGEMDINPSDFSVYNNKFIKGNSINSGYVFNYEGNKDKIVDLSNDNVFFYDNIIDSGVATSPFRLTNGRCIRILNNVFQGGFLNSAMVGFIKANNNGNIDSRETKVFDVVIKSNVFGKSSTNDTCIMLCYGSYISLLENVFTDSAFNYSIAIQLLGELSNVEISNNKSYNIESATNYFIFYSPNENMNIDLSTFKINENITNQAINIQPRIGVSSVYQTNTGLYDGKAMLGDINLYSPEGTNGNERTIKSRMLVKLDGDNSSSGWRDLQIIKRAETSNLPANGSSIGESIFNMTTNTPVFWNGAGWVPAMVKSTAVANSTKPDATDLATAIALVNELKEKLNSKLTADRNSGQQAIQ